MPKQVAKKRFSVGRRVLVGMGMKPATVQSVAEVPSVMGEFVHEVLIDGEKEPRKVLGSEIHPIPDLDEDLRRTHRPTVHIENSNVANLNLGSQMGTINAVLQSLAAGDPHQIEFATALERLTQAVVAESSLNATQRQEILDVLSVMAEQAAKKPEERSKGILKAAAAWLPIVISAAEGLKSLWPTVEPIIKRFLGI